MTWPKAMPLAVVLWDDSQFHEGGWFHPDDLGERLKDELACRSAGYLYREDEERVVLVLSACATGQLGDPLSIPRRAVRSIRIVEPAAPE